MLALEIIHRIAILEPQLSVAAGIVLNSMFEELKVKNMLVGAATILFQNGL